MFAGGDEVVVCIRQYNQDTIHLVLIILSYFRAVCTGSIIVVGIGVGRASCIFPSHGQLYVHIHVYGIFGMSRVYFRFIAAVQFVAAASCNGAHCQHTNEKNTPVLSFHSV